MVLGSGIRDPRSGKILFRIPDPGVKRAPDPGSLIRIRNTAYEYNKCLSMQMPYAYKCCVKKHEESKKYDHFLLLQHCEKSLFVLASRQKIPVLGTENPAVDTRTICLMPIEIF